MNEQKVVVITTNGDETMKEKEIIVKKVKKDVEDKMKMTIPKGTTIYVIDTLKNPMTKKEEWVIRIDNGTGIKKLMPKTIIEKDVLD